MERPPLAAAHRDTFENDVFGLDEDELLGWLVDLRLSHDTELVVDVRMLPRQ